METFLALLALCEGNLPVTGEFPIQRPITRSFGVFFDLSLNKRLRKQSCGWWFKTLSRSLWRHCNRISHVSSESDLCLTSAITMLSTLTCHNWLSYNGHKISPDCKDTEVEAKWPSYSERHIQIITLNNDSNFTEICSPQGPINN